MSMGCCMPWVYCKLQQQLCRRMTALYHADNHGHQKGCGEIQGLISQTNTILNFKVLANQFDEINVNIFWLGSFPRLIDIIV